MDAVTTTATAANAVATAIPGFTGMDGGGLTTSALAGVALSHFLQPYMILVPAALKPLVPIVTGLVGGITAGMSQGLGFKESLHYGLVTTVASLVNHRLAFAKPAKA